MQTEKRTANTDQNLGGRPKRRQRVEIGLYGLGRMGGNMVTRLARGGHRVVAGNRSAEPGQEAAGHGPIGAPPTEDMGRKLKPPRGPGPRGPPGGAPDHTLDEFRADAWPGAVFVAG